jgi:hypothetical protein
MISSQIRHQYFHTRSENFIAGYSGTAASRHEQAVRAANEPAAGLDGPGARCVQAAATN